MNDPDASPGGGESGHGIPEAKLQEYREVFSRYYTDVDGFIHDRQQELEGQVFDTSIRSRSSASRGRDAADRHQEPDILDSAPEGLSDEAQVVRRYAIGMRRKYRPRGIEMPGESWMPLAWLVYRAHELDHTERTQFMVKAINALLNGERASQGGLLELCAELRVAAAFEYDTTVRGMCDRGWGIAARVRFYMTREALRHERPSPVELIEMMRLDLAQLARFVIIRTATLAGELNVLPDSDGAAELDAYLRECLAVEGCRLRLAVANRNGTPADTRSVDVGRERRALRRAEINVLRRRQQLMRVCGVGV